MGNDKKPKIKVSMPLWEKIVGFIIIIVALASVHLMAFLSIFVGVRVERWIILIEEPYKVVAIVPSVILMACLIIGYVFATLFLILCLGAIWFAKVEREGFKVKLISEEKKKR